MEPYTFYFAGELFSQKHLIGNALLAKAIWERSKNKYLPVLPQDLEFRSVSPKDIRDQDLLSLIQCDLALFNFDGPELDSGTVVEFMTAKFADIPSVVLRTDFRNGGDQDSKGDPWNLMCSFYPRTETILASCLETGAQANHDRQHLDNYSPAVMLENVNAQLNAINATADLVISGFDKVIHSTGTLENVLIDSIYQHLRTFPGLDLEEEELEKTIKKVISRKRSRQLL